MTSTADSCSVAIALTEDLLVQDAADLAIAELKALRDRINQRIEDLESAKALIEELRSDSRNHTGDGRSG